ncbi:MAG: LacI family DNA-binding transcriptional regulator, partial [Huintestinicola sp.]
MLGNYKVIGICACEVHSEYPKDIILSICKQLESSDFADYRVILFNSYNSLFTDDDDIKGEASVFNLAEPSIIDVMIILPESIQNKTVTEDIICRMRASNVPVICIDSIFDGCINVVFEYESAFEKIVRHVIKDHGCRTVNFLAGVKGNEASDIREKCFRRVLMENDIKLESGRLDYGGFWDVPTIDAMDRFMASGLSMPDAIICANDAMAISVCRYLKKLGIRVPDDVIVTGFDGIELEKYNTPRLTTAKIDIEYLGNFIEKTVSSLISGQTVDEFLTIPYKSQISQSCRCVPINLSVTNEKIIEVHNMAKRSSYHEDHMFRYIAKATVCNDFDELADVMTGYSDYNFWCCINRDFIVHDPYCKRYGQYFTEDMIQLVRKSGERAEKNITFKAKELLYDLESVFGEFHAIMLCPINFHS